MPSLGEILKEERIKRGINIKDLERITRVRSKYLLAIEKSEFSILPGTTYTRAFIKTYANALGIDPTPLIEEFTKVYQGTSKDPEHAPRVSTKAINPNRRLGYSTTRPLRKRSNAPSVFIIIVVLIIFAFVYIGLRGLWAPQNKTKPNNKKVENNAQNKNTGKEMKVKNINNVYKSILVIKTVNPGSWIRITVDGKIGFDGILTGNSQKSLNGSKFVVRAGNAGAVQVFLDKKDLGKLGQSGEIVEKSFSSEKSK